MANAFHYLLVQLWSGKHVSVKPTRIKDAVTEKAPQFQGYSQHDAQEFSAYILDLLHEDVNIVKKKPFIELAEANGRSDKVSQYTALHFRNVFKKLIMLPFIFEINRSQSQRSDFLKTSPGRVEFFGKFSWSIYLWPEFFFSNLFYLSSKIGNNCIYLRNL